MKFEIGQKVAAVEHYHFYEHIEKGEFYICTIYEITPYSNNTNFLYRAKSNDGNIYAGFENNVSYSPTELISLDYLKSILKRKSDEYRGNAYYMDSLISEVDKAMNEK